MLKRNCAMIKINALVILAALIVLSAGVIFALFTDTDSKNNVFAVGNLDVSLEEPSFDEELACSLTPGKTLAKDPYIENNDKVDAFVFMEVKIPVRNVYTVGSEGKSIERKPSELFDFEAQPEWELISRDEDENFVSYLYVYGSEQEPKILQGVGEVSVSKTSPLFNQVAFANILEGELDEEDISIPVIAYAIQSKSLEWKSASAIFQILTNRLEAE